MNFCSRQKGIERKRKGEERKLKRREKGKSIVSPKVKLNIGREKAFLCNILSMDNNVSAAYFSKLIRYMEAKEGGLPLTLMNERTLFRDDPSKETMLF